MRLVVPSKDILGEGPCWAPAEGRLYWFDIKGRRLNWATPADGGVGHIELPMRASAAAPRSVGGLIMASEHGLVTFESDSATIEIVQPMVFAPGFRTNDGKMDPQGRFWWSTMDDQGGERPGAIFVTTPDGRTEQVLDGIHIPNAISVSADGATLYLADSRIRTIFAYETADLSRRRTFAVSEAAPDGAAIDAEGFLWNAEWGGARIVRYAPDGSVDRIVEAPVDQPTSCAFGGPNLDVLYVTTAREGLSAADLVRQPHAGGLFAFEPGVQGLALPAFAG